MNIIKPVFWHHVFTPAGRRISSASRASAARIAARIEYQDGIPAWVESVCHQYEPIRRGWVETDIRLDVATNAWVAIDPASGWRSIPAWLQ